MGGTHKLGLITKWAICPQLWVFHVYNGSHLDRHMGVDAWRCNHQTDQTG